MRVLLVDDTTFMRMTLRRILESHQIEIVGEADNGVEAIKKYKLLQPDLVIMDIAMPVMDGIEAVKRIKKYDVDASIIMCSLQGQRAHVLEAIKAGAKNYIIKPVKEEKLMREIAKLPLLMFERRRNRTVMTVEDVENEFKAEFGEKMARVNHFEESPEYLNGIEAGYLEARREIAVNMLRLGIADELVLKCVELEEDELDRIRSGYNV